MIWTDRFSQKLINVIRVRSVQIHKYGVYDYIYYNGLKYLRSISLSLNNYEKLNFYKSLVIPILIYNIYIYKGTIYK